MGSNLIEFISTGKVRMREPMSGQPITNKSTTLRLLRCFTGEWTPWPPIGVFLIRHADGPILIDTGASPQCMQAGYFPMLSYLTTVLSELQLAPEDGIVSQLAKLGVKPTDLQAVVLTHLHHDHAGGLEEIVEAAPEVPVYISASHWDAFGKHPTFAAVQGYQSGGPDSPETYFITGDATYSLELLERGEPDGINQDPMTAFESLQLIKKFSEQQKVVVLPSHDVNTSIILEEKRQYRAKQ
ncbi:n-acylhomoserine lactone degredation protein [Colletotrichum kahawae]|uniref:N-acylhomoserine lactone degredation protein n=1 Tax=Colletotrichum kahawae TaxID=34407 RepID=A0AAE0D952_COLKA|nr:n-acylhomoserine lactone degredation protein [Colletotrichum kahawae]